jgi:hypothetical protein
MKNYINYVGKNNENPTKFQGSVGTCRTYLLNILENMESEKSVVSILISSKKDKVLYKEIVSKVKELKEDNFSPYHVYLVLHIYKNELLEVQSRNNHLKIRK